MNISVARAVAEVLRTAERPLTNAEVLDRVRLLRPMETANPVASIRSAIGSQWLAVSLGGRPTRYVWWPNRLAGNCFRQPLASLDPTTGQLALNNEVRLSMWPTFFADRASRPYEVTLMLAGERAIPAQIDFLQPRGWGIVPNPQLAAWFQHQDVSTRDAVIVQVLDVGERRYAMEAERFENRDKPAIARRNQELANETEAILRRVREGQPHWYLIPLLVAQGAYRSSPPPDGLGNVLRADLRFIVREYDIWLAPKLVDSLERESPMPHDPLAAPLPKGNRHKAVDENERLAWGAYLFDRGMDWNWAGGQLEAEAYYREALRADPGHADAWVHLGNLRFEENQVVEALDCYQRGEQAALERTIGDPERYKAPFWLDLDSRPYMRALHGKGLCLWRMGRMDEARAVFAFMLHLNPNDNQGVRFLLPDLEAGCTWEETAQSGELQ